MRHLEVMRERLSGLARIITAVFALGFLSAFFFASPVSAAANRFKVQNVSLETAEGAIVDFSESDILSNVTLNKVNDFAKYTITIKNTDNRAHVIEGITDDNTSPYIAYEYDRHSGETVEPNSDLIFVVTAKYVLYVADNNSGDQANSVKFRIQFTDAAEEIVIVPGTNDEIVSSIAIFILSAAGLAVVVVLSRRKKANKYVAAIIAVVLATTMTSAVGAITVEIGDFTITTNFTLKPGRLIRYDGNYPDGGEMADSYWTADGVLKPNAYTAIGYHFAGWSLEPDEEKVYDDEELMSNIPDGDEPLTLYVIWEQNTYTIVFHANAEQATGSMDSVMGKYDAYRARLPYNEFILDGYRFTGWKVNNEGKLLDDGASSSQFEVEHGGTVNLYAQWEVVPVGVDYYKNSSEAVGITKRQENFGRSTNLRTPNYHRDGYGFAGWNTEPDGTGAMYGPNEYVTMPAEGLKLYAIWAKAEDDTTMQTFDDSAEPYASYPNGKVIALKDARDNQVYAVAKLADGKWWMAENLRLKPAGIELTAENTNNPTQAVQNITSTGSLCTENTAACINQFAYNTSNLSTSGANGIFAYGNGVYYNAYAATAGHAAVDVDNPVKEQVAGDICPRGWHLPTSGENSDFKTLDLALGGTGYNTAGNYVHAQKYFEAPINFIAGGWGEEAFVYKNIGNEAVYLESGTNGLKHNVSSFVESATSINGDTTAKYSLHTIRCLAY